jgi:hypothetical protein
MTNQDRQQTLKETFEGTSWQKDKTVWKMRGEQKDGETPRKPALAQKGV